MRTSHCTGLVRVIAARAPDSWLIKMTEWIISDLKNVLLNITSRGSTIILEELLNRRGLEGSQDALEDVVECLVTKLLEEEEDGGLPLLVRAALHPVGHLLLVWLL